MLDPETNATVETVRNFIGQLNKKRKLSLTDNLIDSGFIDSLNFVQLVLFIESKFKIKIKPFDINIGDFKSVEAIADFILKKRLKK